MPSNHISIDGNHNLVIQDVQGSHIYVNSDEDVQRLLTEQGDKMDQIMQLLQAERSVLSQQWADKIYNIQQAGTVNFNFYGERKIPKYLTPASADVPSSFLGRQAEKAKIHELLFNRSQSLALVNAEGGMGKTALAAYYWQQHIAEYQHLTWLFCERGILAALQSQLPTALGILDQIEATMKQASATGGDIQEASWLTLKGAMTNLKAPCLLVLDNANDPDDIRLFLQKIKGLNWHILLTSRCSNVMTDPESEYTIRGLPPALAKQLFKRNYREANPDFEALLDRFLLAVGYNTLCIEIFSKNLSAGADWGLSTMHSLLAKLETQGLTLGEESFEVNSDWTGQTLDVQTSDQIIEALYHITDLEQNAPELHHLLATLALLPAEGYSAEVLRTLLPADSPLILKNQLDKLVRRGWLSLAEKGYRMSPVVQKIVLQKIPAPARWALGAPLVQRLQGIFETEGYHPKNIATAAPFADLVFGLITHLAIANDDLVVLMDRLWVYYKGTGNLTLALDCAEKMKVLSVQFDSKNRLSVSYSRLGDTYISLGNLGEAMRCYEQSNLLYKELCARYPENVDFKKGLAISYSQLGETQSKLGNLNQTLAHFEKSYTLRKELHASNPENEDLKYDIVISYSKLGQAHEKLGNLQQALLFFEIRKQLSEELYDCNPDNSKFKNGLAISFQYLGSIHSKFGNWLEALAFFKKCNHLAEELVTTYPNNVYFKNGLAISCQYLGNTYSDLSNLLQALAFYEKFTSIMEELHSTTPTDVGYIYGLASSYEKLGTTHKALSHLQQAIIFFELENKVFEGLYKAYPQNVEFKNSLAKSYISLGMLYGTTFNEQIKTRENYLHSQALLKELVASFPDYAEFQQNLQWVENKLSEP